MQLSHLATAALFSSVLAHGGEDDGHDETTTSVAPKPTGDKAATATAPSIPKETGNGVATPADNAATTDKNRAEATSGAGAVAVCGVALLLSVVVYFA